MCHGTKIKGTVGPKKGLGPKLDICQKSRTFVPLIQPIWR